MTDATEPGYKVAMAPSAKVVSVLQQPELPRKKDPTSYEYHNTGLIRSSMDDQALLRHQTSRPERHHPVKNYSGTLQLGRNINTVHSGHTSLYLRNIGHA